MSAISPITMTDLMTRQEFPALLSEYAAESSIEGMPGPDAKLETYRQIEASGMLRAFAAERDARMIGFITVLAAVLPHYGALVAVTESFFVTASQRGMIGLQLLATAEKHARECGSPGLLVSAPFGSRLCELLPKVGYSQTNSVYFKGLGNG